MTRHSPCAISWSGGKDCFLALVTLLEQKIVNLEDVIFVTFVPETGDFLCHPLGILEAQSQQLQVSHEFLIVDLDHWEAGYRQALKFLKETYRVSQFVTGEILLNDSSQETYWLQNILDELHIQLANPVTPKPARYMLELLKQYQITAITTGIKQQFYHPDFLGQPISWELLERTNLSQLQNFGWYGENGEYHTLVSNYRDYNFLPPIPQSTELLQSGEVLTKKLPAEFHQLKHNNRRKLFPA